MTNEEIKSRLGKSLKAIKDLLESDIMDVDIESQKNKLLKLTQITGLAAEVKAQAKKLLRMRELEVLKELQEKKIAPSILSKLISSRCHDEEAMLEYADRLNAGVSHSIDGIRSVISLYKTELENSMKG